MPGAFRSNTARGQQRPRAAYDGARTGSRSPRSRPWSRRSSSIACRTSSPRTSSSRAATTPLTHTCCAPWSAAACAASPAPAAAPPPGYRYYQCRGKLMALHSHRDTLCPARHIPAGQLDALVWDDLCQVLTHPETLRLALERAHGGHWLPQELQGRGETLRRGQTGLQRQVERLTEAYLAGVVRLEEYQRRRRDLEQ